MGIRVNEVIQVVRGLAADDKEKFFKNTFVMMGINGAIEKLYKELQSVSEFQWLKKYTITITAQNVTDEETQYDLAERIFYVSNYFTDKNRAGRDWRPVISDGVDDRRLDYVFDYSISLPYFVLNKPPESTGTITYYGKAMRARVVKEDEIITELPDIVFNYLVEYAFLYCERRDENEQKISSGRLAAELEEIRLVLNTSGGSPRGFEPNWDDVPPA